MTDDDIKNFLYRLHFPCQIHFLNDPKKCNCDRVIEKAQKYLNDNVIRKTNEDKVS
jgi:hypothetical protein